MVTHKDSQVIKLALMISARGQSMVKMLQRPLVINFLKNAKGAKK